MVFPASFSFSWSVPAEAFVLDFLTPYVVTVAMQCSVVIHKTLVVLATYFEVMITSPLGLLHRVQVGRKSAEKYCGS